MKWDGARLARARPTLRIYSKAGARCAARNTGIGHTGQRYSRSNPAGRLLHLAELDRAPIAAGAQHAPGKLLHRSAAPLPAGTMHATRYPNTWFHRAIAPAHRRSGATYSTSSYLFRGFPR